MIDKSKKENLLKISEEIYFKMLELEREAAATTDISTQDPDYPACAVFGKPKNSEAPTGFERMTSAIPVRCSRLRLSSTYNIPYHNVT